MYRIANNVGGVKHWRIWQIYGGSPIFNPPKRHVKSLYHFGRGLRNTWYQRCAVLRQSNRENVHSPLFQADYQSTKS